MKTKWVQTGVNVCEISATNRLNVIGKSNENRHLRTEEKEAKVN